MEGSIVLHRPSSLVDIPLDCIDIEPAEAGCRSVAEWRLTFGVGADWQSGAAHQASLATGLITGLRIVGVEPVALRSMVVRRGDTVLFALDAHVGLHGHVSTAGEILQAMSRYRGDGDEGLLLDLPRGIGAGGVSQVRARLRVRSGHRQVDPGSTTAWTALRVSVVAVVSEAAGPRSG